MWDAVYKWGHANLHSFWPSSPLFYALCPRTYALDLSSHFCLNPLPLCGRHLWMVPNLLLTMYESVVSLSSLTLVKRSPESGSILKSSDPFKLYSILPLSPRSASWAVIRRIFVPTGKFSRTLARMAEVGKVGGLSLISWTLIVTAIVPVSWGDPPSTDVTVKRMTSRVSRSKAPVKVK